MFGVKVILMKEPSNIIGLHIKHFWNKKDYHGSYSGALNPVLFYNKSFSSMQVKLTLL